MIISFGSVEEKKRTMEALELLIECFDHEYNALPDKQYLVNIRMCVEQTSVMGEEQ